MNSGIATQQKALQFANYWQGKGDEKQETQQFWMALLGDVLGVPCPSNYIEFEKRVQLSHTSFIDAYIPATKVLIEQKSVKFDLHKAYEQSDGSLPSSKAIRGCFCPLRRMRKAVRVSARVRNVMSSTQTTSGKMQTKNCRNAI